MPIFEFSSPPTSDEIQTAQNTIAELEQDGMLDNLRIAKRELGQACYDYLSTAEKLRALHDLAELACQDLTGQSVTHIQQRH